MSLQLRITLFYHNSTCQYSKGVFQKCLFAIEIKYLCSPHLIFTFSAHPSGRLLIFRSSDSSMGKSKKQSLIPFPRTGKRSADTAEEMALVYQHMDNLDNLGTSDYDVDDEQYNSPDDAVVDDVVGDDGESSDGGDDDGKERKDSCLGYEAYAFI